MQAGCYGRAFCPVGSYPRKRILQICQSLRILNALRSSNVGVPLTLPQLEALTPSVLISRLVNARRHLLALRIAEMLNMDTDKVCGTQNTAPAQFVAFLQQTAERKSALLTTPRQKWKYEGLLVCQGFFVINSYLWMTLNS